MRFQVFNLKFDSLFNSIFLLSRPLTLGASSKSIVRGRLRKINVEDDCLIMWKQGQQYYDNEAQNTGEILKRKKKAVEC